MLPTQKPNISFFFPAYNDAGTIKKLTLKALEVLEEVANEYEIIIVNDGSFDNTGKVADDVAKKYDHVIVHHHLYNIGYGAALKTGFLTSKYDLIFYTDGDMQYNPDELKKMLPFIEDADIITGYKIKRADPWSRKLSSLFYNLVVRLFLQIRIKDVDTAFKLVKKEVIENIDISINGGFICAELFAKAAKKGYKIKQIPVSHFPRTYGNSSSFNIFFILRSILELMELWWNIVLRDKFFYARQNFWKFIYAKSKRVPSEDKSNIEDISNTKPDDDELINPVIKY